MKTENTVENKAAFFALYWGQKVVINSLFDFGDLIEVCMASFALQALPHLSLELKPLSQIPDEDAIYIAKLFNDDFSEAKIIDLLHVVKEDVLSLLYDIEVEGRSFNEIILVSDFLRSRGYALPWMGLSVDDLIEYGWVKLKGVDHA